MKILPKIQVRSKANLFKNIKAVILDVDGVMTDGGLYVFENGEHVRRFNVKDGWGIKELMKHGIHVAVISAGSGEGLRKRLNHLGIKDVFLSTKDKLATFKRYALEIGVPPSEVAYMGDDMPDFALLNYIGLPCCPADAMPAVASVCQFVSKYNGGYGAVRELAEKVLEANK